jgi:hypothetical protein
MRSIFELFQISPFFKANYHRPVGVFAVAAGLQTISLGYSTTELSNFYATKTETISLGYSTTELSNFYATKTDIFIEWGYSSLNQMVMKKSVDKKM